MKTRRYQMLALAVALIAMSSIAYAQRGQCQGCGNYNPSTEITINGVVEEVVHMPASGRGPGGVHLMVRADAGTFDVHLGPASFIDAQAFAFAKGDTVTVLGSKQHLDGRDVVIARELTKNGRTLTLRDARGVPAWSGKPKT